MKNSLKASLRDQRLTVGAWNSIPDTYIGEILAGAGFDWMVIDSEHGPFELNDVLRQHQATGRHDIHAAARLPGHDPDHVKRILDMGITSLVFPVVETGEQVRSIVSSCHYPPEGTRGVGPALSRAADWGNDQDYLETASGNICIICQVETEHAVNNLDELTDTADVDCFFIGPSDLATSLGYKGNYKHPEAEKIIFSVLGRIRDSGISAGILALDPEWARKCRDHGANMIGVCSDIVSFSAEIRRTYAIYSDPGQW